MWTAGVDNIHVNLFHRFRVYGLFKFSLSFYVFTSSVYCVLVTIIYYFSSTV